MSIPFLKIVADCGPRLSNGIQVSHSRKVIPAFSGTKETDWTYLRNFLEPDFNNKCFPVGLRFSGDMGMPQASIVSPVSIVDSGKAIFLVDVSSPTGFGLLWEIDAAEKNEFLYPYEILALNRMFERSEAFFEGNGAFDGGQSAISAGSGPFEAGREKAGWDGNERTLLNRDLAICWCYLKSIKAHAAQVKKQRKGEEPGPDITVFERILWALENVGIEDLGNFQAIQKDIRRLGLISVREALGQQRC